MAYTLFEEFLEDGLTALRVARNDWPIVKQGVTFIGGKINPISIDWLNRCVYIFPNFFELMYYGVDAPTPMRLFAYIKASQWCRSIRQGSLCTETEYDSVTALSIATIKGVQLFFNDNLLQLFPLVKKRIKELTGLSADITVAKSSNGDYRRVVYVKSDDASNQYISKLESLIQSESSLKKPLDRLSEGELGSKSNPFPDVSAAANYILRIEEQRLVNDKFRTFVNDTQCYYDPAQRTFRIPWATPFVGYLDGSGVIENGFVVNQLASRRFNFKPNLIGRKFLFRGQAEFFDNCVPNMFRNHKDDYFLKYTIFSCEMRLLLDSHPLVKLFNNGVELFHDKFVFEVNYGGLSQHYYNKTKFLDLTSDMEAAKFFAVTTFDMSNNCYVPFDKEGVGVLYYYDIEPDAFIPNRPNYQLSAIGKQPFMRSGAQHGYLLAMEKGVNFNAIPQVRCVFFKHDKSVTDEIFNKSGNGSQYMSDDILQHHWFSKLSDSKRRNTVSHEAVMENWKYNKTTSKRKLLKELTEAGVEVVRNAIPKFSTDELKEYYFNSAEEIWREFCKDIYFYSPEGRILKEHMLNLPRNPAYRQYFYE